MRIAVFDYLITPNNPIGGCHRRMLEGLSREHEFTVFAVEFDNPCPERIRWVRIPAPHRPLAALFLVFHVLAPLWYLFYRLRGGARFDLVQMVESNLLFGDVCYTQFCHRAYLLEHWKALRPSGLRGWLRWLDHRCHALLEPWVYSRRRRLITPSRGLAAELVRHYGEAASDKALVISNPVDLEKMRRPPDFDRQAFRGALGIAGHDLAIVFCALGHFERKGLGLLMDALVRCPGDNWKLIVVGGQPDAVAVYRAAAHRAGIGPRVIFAGMQRDVRGYLWAADAFVFPSAYETFSLVTFEAAAAGAVIVAPRLYGVEEFLRDGHNGILTERTRDGLSASLARLFSMPPEARLQMGRQAQHDVESYGLAAFIDGWRRFYRGLNVA